MTHLHLYTHIFRLLRVIQPQSIFQAHLRPQSGHLQVRAARCSPTCLQIKTPPPPLHRAISPQAETVGHVTAVSLLQSVSGGHAGAPERIHAQPSAGMPHSTASFLTATTGLFFWWKKMRRGAQSAAGRTYLMEGTGATSGL